MAGLYFEEFEIGQIFKHQPGRTVTEMDNVMFTCLTMNPQPLHLDEEFAKETQFGQRLVNSILTLGHCCWPLGWRYHTGYNHWESGVSKSRVSPAGVSR